MINFAFILTFSVKAFVAAVLRVAKAGFQHDGAGGGVADGVLRAEAFDAPPSSERNLRTRFKASVV